MDLLIETKKPREYDQVVVLLADLAALARQKGQQTEFATRMTELHQRHSRKPSLLTRLDWAGL